MLKVVLLLVEEARILMQVVRLQRPLSQPELYRALLLKGKPYSYSSFQSAAQTQGTGEGKLRQEMGCSQSVIQDSLEDVYGRSS